MPDTSVKIFNSSMPGAPTVGGASGGSWIAVLDACLKDGFGLVTLDSLVVADGIATATIASGHSAIQDAVVLLAGATPAELNGEKKVLSTTTNTVVFDATGVADGTATGTITLKLAPAGWTKEFAGTNLAAYKSSNPAATGCLLRVDDTSTTDIRVVAYESMTDVNTGSGPFPTAAQQAGGLYVAKANNTSGTRKWWLIASDRFVLFGIAWYSSRPDDYTVNGFGDFVSRKAPDGYKFLVSGNPSQYSGSTISALHSVLFNKAATASTPQVAVARPYTQVGGSALLGTAFGANISSGVSGVVGYQYPNGPDNGLLLDAVQLFEGSSNCLRGSVPGVLASLQATAGVIVNDSVFTDIPGYPGRSFVWKSIGATSDAARGGILVDITGPWVS